MYISRALRAPCNLRSKSEHCLAASTLRPLCVPVHSRSLSGRVLHLVSISFGLDLWRQLVVRFTATGQCKRPSSSPRPSRGLTHPVIERPPSGVVRFLKTTKALHLGPLILGERSLGPLRQERSIHTELRI